jgi:hypothetical protein
VLASAFDELLDEDAELGAGQAGWLLLAEHGWRRGCRGSASGCRVRV